MESTNVNVDPYELLEIKIEATEQEIRTAYRQRSLKVHPDRNPNNSDAARRFHELNQAYELLLDPLRRLALDAKLRLKHARQERYAAYDGKRKAMLDELDAAEKKREDEIRTKRARQEEEAVRWQRTMKIKEEGRRMREEKEARLRKADEERRRLSNVNATQDEVDPPPALDSLDTTVHLKYTLKAHPKLTTTGAIAELLAQFGKSDEDTIVLSLKAGKGKGKMKGKGESDDKQQQPKFGSALVPFKQIGDAFAAVCASGVEKRGMKGIEVTWVGGKEPPILGWLKRRGKLGGDTTTTAERTDVKVQERIGGESQTMYSSFPASFPDVSIPIQDGGKIPTNGKTPGLDYESITLMRLRQAERERLEREIREREAAEEVEAERKGS